MRVGMPTMKTFGREGELAVKLAKLHKLRQGRHFQEADELRAEILAMDEGFRIRLTPDKAILEHWPVPLFTLDQFKGLNFGMFVTDSTRG